jgi:hypothetical protein
MRGRPPGSRNKKRKSDEESKDAKSRRRKRHQRSMEAAVRLHEFLTAEAEKASAANPAGDPAFFYQGTQAKILGKIFDRVDERLKRGHR